MNFNKIILFVCLLFFILLINKSIFAAENVCVGADDYVHGDCDGEDDDEYDVATIAPEDGCQVTCTDPDNEEVYTLRATGTSTVIDDTFDNVEIYFKIEYVDSEGGVTTLKEATVSDSKQTYRGMVVSFSSFYNKEDSILRQVEAPGSLEGNRVNYRISAFSYAPYYLWLLFYASSLAFSVSDTVTATYSHTLNYNTCDDTYLELHVCADAATKLGKKWCYYSENTALVDCYVHQDGYITHIRSVDSEGEWG